MWNDTRKRVPEKDGTYLVQVVAGDVIPITYTVKGGWNTSMRKGKLEDEHAINDNYVVRWYEVEKPEAVPSEWVDEWLETI